MWQRWLCFWVTAFTRSVQHVAEVKLRLEPSTIFSSWTYGFNFKLLHRLVLKISTSQTCVSGLQWDDNTPRTRSKNLSNLFHLSVSGSLEPIPASIGREAGYIQVASLSQARGEHANSAWAGKQDYISHIAPLSHIQWWLYQAHPAVPTTEFLTSVKESLEMEWFSWTGLTDLFHLGRLYLVEVPGTRFAFWTYSAGIPSDLRWFKNDVMPPIG